LPSAGAPPAAENGSKSVKTKDFEARFIPSGLEQLDARLKFTAEIDAMTGVLRRTVLLDRSRRENDAEHSWHIAVMVLLIAEYAVEKPNVHHAVEMLPVHDLVEIYAGDTFAYDIPGNRDKSEREKDAADRLYAILPPGRESTCGTSGKNSMRQKLQMPNTPTVRTGCSPFCTTL